MKAESKLQNQKLGNSGNFGLTWPPMKKLIIAALMASFVPLAEAEPIRLEVDPIRSSLGARSGRSGILGFFGHEHGVMITRWVATIRYDAATPADSRLELVGFTSSLMVDTPEARRFAGLKESGPSPKDQKEIQEKLLSPEMLHAEKFQQLSFQSTEIKRGTEKNMLEVRGDLTLKGVTHQITAPVEIEPWKDGAYHLTTRFEIKLSEFGINRPKGVVGVKDEVEIRVEIFSKPPTAVAMMEK